MSDIKKEAVEHIVGKSAIEIADACTAHMTEHDDFYKVNNQVASKVERALDKVIKAERERIVKEIEATDDKPCVCSINGVCEYNKGFQKARWWIINSLKE